MSTDRTRNNQAQQIFQQIAGAYDAPAFIRRARETHAAWDQLVAQAEKERTSLLRISRLELARLRALSNNFNVVVPELVSAAELRILIALYEEWRPQLRRPVLPTENPRVICTALDRFVAAADRFNRRWLEHVSEIDLDPVNELRDGYNKYYPIEKECALQSWRTATHGFVPLDHATREDVLACAPLLPEIRPLP